MEEDRGISSGLASEPASDSWAPGENRNGNGIEDKDEFGSKRLKVQDLGPDAKSDGNIGIVQQPDHSSEVSELTDAEGLGREISEKELVAKDRKPFPVLETSSCLPKTDDNRCVANSGKQFLLEDHNVTGDSNCESRREHVDSVPKISTHLTLKEFSLSIASPCGAAESDIRRDPFLSIPSSGKFGPSQMCSPVGSMGGSDSMRQWMEMKRNGFVSGPLGGVPAPNTPTEVPAQKQRKKRRGTLKKKNEVLSKEPKPVGRLPYTIGPPSGLLNNINPAIIRNVRTPKQVCSFLEALVGDASDNATVGGKHANRNVRESVTEDEALAFELPSSGVLDSLNSITDPQQAMLVTVEAATVASQWLEFLHQDLSWRLSAVQDFRNRVLSILTYELPLLASSRDSSFNKESTLQSMNMDTSGDGSSEKTVTETETHEIKWATKFEQTDKALYIEESDLTRSLNQVKEILSSCNNALCQMEESSPFSSQSSDSSAEETSMAVRAAAASIFSTFSFLQSMMKPAPSS